ncbi:dienelactone hydrolase family protein [Streptomyces dysideae]|uniref:Hydrolase n=1 Tax=Streptomyces dysideae TaxID=909626 RepID=A0A117RXE4_9ACTN|nr:dienelactone hydrolase family protein [Streptomyces dysideae]KUO14555.1 hydrolase [Streptomyces dysideae]
MISEMVSVPAARVNLSGDLAVPTSARAMVLFAHGIDRSRHSRHSRSIAAQLRTAGFGTLLVDLLSEGEDRRDALADEQRLDVGLLGHRLVAAVDWVKIQPETRGLPVVLLGTGTEAAAVLEAAAELPDRVLTVVLWGGRPDLAGDAPGRVRVPVLVLAGSQDPAALRLSEETAARLSAPHSVRVLPDAIQPFEERGSLEQAVARTREWCDDLLRPSREGPDE